MLRETTIMLVFLAGFLFCLFFKSKDVWGKKEGFANNSCPNLLMQKGNSCPNLLMQKGNQLLLFNNTKARIPGINPVRFNNLEEYIEFVKWQRRLGIRCPVLYFQQTYDTQNNLGWRPMHSPTSSMSGTLPGMPPRPPIASPLIDANRLDPPYNAGDYPGYDPDNQYIGVETPLDKIYNEPSDAMHTGAESKIARQERYFEQRRARIEGREVPLVNGGQGPVDGGDFASYNAQKDADAQHTSKSKAA